MTPRKKNFSIISGSEDVVEFYGDGKSMVESECQPGAAYE